MSGQVTGNPVNQDLDYFAEADMDSGGKLVSLEVK